MIRDRIRRRPDVLWRRSLDAVVLLPAGDGDVLTLPGTGPAVWELLAEWRSFEDLVEILAGAFEADRDLVSADLSSLIDDLRERGVIQTAADSGGHEAE